MRSDDCDTKVSKSGLVMKGRLSSFEKMQDQSTKRLDKAFQSMLRRTEREQIYTEQKRIKRLFRVSRPAANNGGNKMNDVSKSQLRFKEKEKSQEVVQNVNNNGNPTSNDIQAYSRNRLMNIQTNKPR